MQNYLKADTTLIKYISKHTKFFSFDRPVKYQIRFRRILLIKIIRMKCMRYISSYENVEINTFK